MLGMVGRSREGGEGRRRVMQRMLGIVRICGFLSE